MGLKGYCPPILCVAAGGPVTARSSVTHEQASVSFDPPSLSVSLIMYWWVYCHVERRHPSRHLSFSGFRFASCGCEWSLRGGIHHNSMWCDDGQLINNTNALIDVVLDGMKWVVALSA